MFSSYISIDRLISNYPLFTFILTLIHLQSLLTNAITIQTTSSGQYENLPINCGNTEACTVICDDSEACRNSQINCPKDYPCNVQCLSSQSCEFAQFYCPIDQPCDIHCDAGSACNQASFNATYSSSFNLDGCATGFYTCTGVTIHFPPNVGGTPVATITGDNSLSAGISPSVPLQFYAINGWSDVNVVGYTGDFSYPQGDMYCTNDYSVSCNFASAAWACDNPTDLCQTLTGDS